MKHILRSLSVCLMFFLFATQTQASHFQGAEISYSCISGCTYRITVTEYFECSGILTPPAAPSSGLSFFPMSACTPVTPTPLAGWVLESDEEVTPLSPSIMATGTTCSSPGASIEGVRKVVFYRDYDFCSTTCPIQVSLSSCCRNGSVINILDPSNTSYEVHANIWDPTLCNQSPVWLDNSYTILDEGNSSRISMAAYDADGDSLVYGIDSIADLPGIGISYNMGYSTYLPLGLTTIPFINSATGDLFISPTMGINGLYTVGVSVREYRDGILLGKYYRDFTINIQSGLIGFDDNPYLEPYGPPLMNPVGATYIDSFIVEGKIGVPITLPIQGVSPSFGDTVTMTWSENLPGSFMTDVSTGTITDSVVGFDPVATLHWTPSSLGRFAFNVRLENGPFYAGGLAEYSFVIVVDSCDLTVDIGPDSMSVCSSDTITLSSALTGGLAPYTYIWSNGENTPSITVTHSPAMNYPLTYILWVEDSLGCIATDTITIDFDLPCVWPGDADNDGVADNNDLLALGLTFGNTGAMRAGATLTWTSQPATAWADTLPSGVNSVYADTDGSGLVDADDTLAINLNYGLTHNKREGISGGPGDPPLFVFPTLDSTLVGTQVVMPIILGLDTLPATNVYGIAFTIQYDPSLVDSASANIEYTGWLGTVGTDLLGIQKDFHKDGEIDVALTRTDMISMTGYGAIAQFSIVMIDDIAGKNTISEVLKFDITNVRVIGTDGNEIPVHTQASQIVVTEQTSTGIAQGLGTKLNVYPQPAQDQVFIELETPQAWEATLYTLSGQTIQTISTQNLSKLQISLAGLPSGLYLLRVQNEQGQAVRKLEVRR